MKIRCIPYEGALKALPADIIVTFVSESKTFFVDSGLQKVAQEVLSEIKLGELSAEKIVASQEGWKCGRIGFFCTDLIKNSDSFQQIENTVAQAISFCRSRGWLDIALVVNGTTNETIRRIIDSALLSQYSFNKYKSAAKKNSKKTLTLRFVLPEGCKNILGAREKLSECVNGARQIVNEPANVATIEFIVAEAKKIAKECSLKINVIQREELQKKGYRGLLAVGAGGHQTPRMVVLSYVPAKTKCRDHVCLLGKGIVFDSGGISLKPPPDMWTMKGDMAGAAAVLYSLKSLAGRKVPVRVTAILCLAENLPDSNAVRPGDVFVAANGKTVHVDNTDAEGRLVLSDGLFHAGREGATHIIDFATLTGACVVALGERIAGVMGNDDQLIDDLRKASDVSGDRIWPLPLPADYRSYLDTHVADINNVGGRFGGAITGGIFLKEFVPDGVKWAHVDIAGPSFTQKKWGYFAEGATGFGVRLIDAYFDKF